MMWHEFEELAGYEVSFEDYYKFIEPMYMTLDVSKADFVGMISKKRFALKPLSWYVKEMKKHALELKRTCTHYTDKETLEQLEALADDYARRKYGEAAGWWLETETRFTCSYPWALTIYDTHTWDTLEKLQLTQKNN